MQNPPRSFASVEELPEEILIKIFGWLDPIELCSVALVSQQWHRLHYDSLLWFPIAKSFSRWETHAIDKWYLLTAGMTVAEAQQQHVAINWKQEAKRRKTFTVLLLNYHSSHVNGGYDADLARQLHERGITKIDICHPNCNLKERCANGHCDHGRFVKFSPTLLNNYPTVFYFCATNPSTSHKKLLGNMFYEYISNGGGLVLTAYTHLEDNLLEGRWDREFYVQHDGGLPREGGTQKATFGEKLEKDHPLLAGVNDVEIVPHRGSSRCLNRCVNPKSRIIANYADGLVFVAFLDAEANRQIAINCLLQENIKERQTEAEKGSNGTNENNNNDSMDEEKKEEIKEEEISEELRNDILKKVEEEVPASSAWGKTVWINLFPLSINPRGNGWYAPTSDVPKLLANAVLFAARKGNN